MSNKCRHQVEEVPKVPEVARWLFLFLLSILAKCEMFPHWKSQTPCSNSSLLIHTASPESPTSWWTPSAWPSGADCREEESHGLAGGQAPHGALQPSCHPGCFLLPGYQTRVRGPYWLPLKTDFSFNCFFLLSIPSLPNLIKYDREQGKIFHFTSSSEATEAVSTPRSPNDLSCILHIYIHTYVCV